MSESSPLDSNALETMQTFVQRTIARGRRSIELANAPPQPVGLTPKVTKPPFAATSTPCATVSAKRSG